MDEMEEQILFPHKAFLLRFHSLSLGETDGGRNKKYSLLIS